MSLVVSSLRALSFPPYEPVAQVVERASRPSCVYMVIYACVSRHWPPLPHSDLLRVSAHPCPIYLVRYPLLGCCAEGRAVCGRR